MRSPLPKRRDGRTRTLQRYSTLLAAFAIAPWLCAAHAQAPATASAEAPVPIGMVLAKQGFVADSAIDGANGAMLEVEQHGAKVLGRPIKLIWYDEPNPQAAQQNMTRLIEQDKVVAVIGGSASASSMAISAVAATAKIPTIIVFGAASELTGAKCNRYTFRTATTTDFAARALAPELLKKGKKWYFLVANYSFGQGMYDSSVDFLKQHGGSDVGHDLVPNGTADFSSLLLKVRQADPDVVVVALGGVDLDNLLKQFPQYAGRAELGTPLISDSAIWAAGSGAQGLYGKQWHYADAGNSADERAFVKAWRAKYDDKPPSNGAWQGWMSMRMLLAAIERAHTTDGPAVAKTLETLKLPGGGSMPDYYRSWDHQFIHQLDVARAHPPVPGRDKWDMLDIIDKVPRRLADVDALYGTPASVGCKMGNF
ncbi:MAG: ABC transporter substrate-binding protein [Janthinobacterium lividum]